MNLAQAIDPETQNYVAGGFALYVPPVTPWDVPLDEARTPSERAVMDALDEDLTSHQLAHRLALSVTAVRMAIWNLIDRKAVERVGDAYPYVWRRKCS